ncbi:DNA-directed RNA polymerase III subunit RPC6, partial [Phenoliferia sp. Uapishka_3]
MSGKPSGSKPAQLSAQEKKFQKIGLAAPNKTISQNDLIKEAGVSVSGAVSEAINSLLRKNLMTMLKTQKGEISFRFIGKDEVKATGSMDSEEKLVYDQIKDAGNQGIWTKIITTRTGLPRGSIAKALKVLEMKKAIKSVKSVKTPTRKIYMLAGLTPSVEITGGPWFTDNELDLEFVTMLKRCAEKLLQDTSIPGGSQIYPTSMTPFLPTVKDVKDYISSLKVAAVELMDEHVESLLDLMVYDGTVEKIMVQNVQRVGGSREKKRKHKGKGVDSDNESGSDDEPKRKKRKAKPNGKAKGKKAIKTKSNGKKRAIVSDDDESEGSSDAEFDSDEDVETARIRNAAGTSKKRRKERKRRGGSDSDSDAKSDNDDGVTSDSSKGSDDEDEDEKPEFDFNANDFVYRLTKTYNPRIGWTDMPCGRCPVESFCSEASRPLGAHHGEKSSSLGMMRAAKAGGGPKVGIEISGMLQGVGMMGGVGAAIGASNDKWGEVKSVVGFGVAPVNPRDSLEKLKEGRAVGWHSDQRGERDTLTVFKSINSTDPTAPVQPPNWTYTPENVDAAVEGTIDKTKALLDAIVALPANQRTFDTVFRQLALREGEAAKESEPAIFLQYVSTDEAIRDRSVAGDKKIQDFDLESVTRIDVYEALLDAKKHTEENKVALNPEEQRLMDRMLRDRQRNGLALAPEKRDALLEVAHFPAYAYFGLQELDGVPEDVIGGFSKEGDKLKVTFKTQDIVPLFKYANLPATRKAAVLGYEGKTIENAPRLEEIVKLRKEAAAILGFKNYAEFVLEVKMAKTPEKVFEFLDDLESKLRPLGEAERVELLALKKEIHEAKGWDYDGKMYLWDYRYLDRLWMEKNLKLDDEKIKEYFPVTYLVPAILNIYKTMLNVRFHPVPRTAEAGGITWHEDAEMYAVWDGGKDGQDGHFLGYMHLDLFPRPNKYGHAAVWGLIPGWDKPDGSRNYPVVNMVANLAKSTPTRPALMKHGDVVTFFHEMGHAFHGLLSSTQFARFHGTAVARDFVEAPSQMLENWCWTSPQLKDMSSHFERPEETLPDALIESIIKHKSAGQGLFNLRQIFHARYDMIIHTTAEEQDLTKLWCDLREKTSLVTTDGVYVGGQSGFAHIVGVNFSCFAEVLEGYESGYYGYLWSQVFSADMFKTVFEKDPMDQASGKHYRDKILSPGGSRDEMQSLVEFLGREPTNKAFLESLIGSDSEAKL